MAGYQNNMRYGRPGNMYRQRGNDCSCDRQRIPEQQTISRDCGCGHHRDEFEGMPLAMAYVPWQNWREIYDICEGFQRGTIFPELDMPFHGRGGCNR